jgi:hypothetical protein
LDPQLQQMLEQLRDVHHPGSTGWWPIAPGWWVLAALLILAAVSLVLFLRHRSRISAYKKEALVLLEQAHQEWQEKSDAAHYLSRCAEILRRLLLYRRGRDEIAPLSGTQWRELLENTGEGKLSESSLDALVVQQYRPNPEFDSEMLYQDLRQYIASQRPSAHV